MTPTVRQEARPARPDITEVAPGIARLELPIRLTGLGHVNCYLLEDERGVAVVDPGLPGDEPWQALLDGLRRAGVPLRRVHTVVVTHSHPDHFGGAARLRETTGAAIVTHHRFRPPWLTSADLDGPEPEQLAHAHPPPDAAGDDRNGDDRNGDDRDGDDRDGDDAARHDDPGPIERRTRWGGTFRPPPVEGDLDEATARRIMVESFPTPTVLLDDAEPVRLAGRDWVAVHTPGHTPDHLCLLDRDEGVLLAGDHVLPTITPHIGGLGELADPLAEYLASLQRVAALAAEVTCVLPAHGDPFTDLAGRVAAIAEHHDERLQRLVAGAGAIGREATVPELMRTLFSERSWGSMAESETYAHLEHLRLGGRAEARWHDDYLWYSLTGVS